MFPNQDQVDEYGRRSGKKRHLPQSSASSCTQPTQQRGDDTYVQKWKYKVPDEEDDKKQKKEVSNAVKKEKERERRGRMTDSIEVLRALIPQCKDKKINQSRVMELAVYHIQALERKIEEQKRYISELQGAGRNTKRQKVSEGDVGAGGDLIGMETSQAEEMSHISPPTSFLSSPGTGPPNSENEWPQSRDWTNPAFPAAPYDEFMAMGTSGVFEVRFLSFLQFQASPFSFINSELLTLKFSNQYLQFFLK